MRGKARSPERRVVCEDASLKLLQLRSRLEPELLHEPPPRRAVRLKRASVSTCAIEREHELPEQSLSERMLADELFELRYQLCPLRILERNVHPLLDDDEPALLETLGCVLRERLEQKIAKRGTVP